ncbi:PIN-like domain-containing protein [Vibrio splendidus]
MRLGYYEFDTTVEEHHKSLQEIASDEKTLIFLDTNILAYLYKLHANARKEFFDWAKTIKKQNRLFLPHWAANEYSNRVTTNKLHDYTNRKKSSDNVSPDKAKKMYDTLYEMASLFVDEEILASCNFPGDRTQFLDEFKNAINSLDTYTSAFKTQFKVGDIHKEIVENFSDIVLESNLSELCARAEQEGPSRFEHRLPPGFKDDTKNENRFGDLIIWFEILTKAHELEGTFDKVLFVSNDEKPDWVYAPIQRANENKGQRKIVANKNPVLKIAHPRLVDEFETKVGHKNFTICTLADLIESLSKVEPALLTNIAGAIQIEIQIESDDAEVEAANDEPDEVQSTPEVVGDVPTDTGNELGAANNEPYETESAPVLDNDAVFEYELEALQDSLYQCDGPGEINEIITELKTHNWYKQNPAIIKIMSLAHLDLDPSASFVLGRNIYQAACGNSQKAIEFMTSLARKLSMFDNDIANHVLAGMAFEIYFDGLGQPRQQTKFDYAETVLKVITIDGYEPAKNFISTKVRASTLDLVFIPGDLNEPKHDIIIEVSEDETKENSFILNSVQFNDQELIEDDDENPDNSWSRRVYTAIDLYEDISNEYSVPRWALRIQNEHNLTLQNLLIPVGKKLK